MYPVIQAGQKWKVRQLPLLPSRLNLFFVLSINVVHSSRGKLAAEVNSYNLAFKKVAFISLEVRVRADELIQIACKHIFDSSWSVNLLWSHYGKLLPICSKKIGSHPISHLVDTCSFWLNIWWQLSFLCSLGCSLNDKIVFALAKDRAPEFNFLRLLRDAKLL